MKHARIRDQFERRIVELVTLHFDAPPSANALFANNPRTGGRMRTRVYEAWRQSAATEIMTQRPGRIVGRYGIGIEVRRASLRRDLDNALKGISDILVEMGIVEDDRFAEHIEMCWTDDEAVTGVNVRVWQEKPARAA